MWVVLGSPYSLHTQDDPLAPDEQLKPEASTGNTKTITPNPATTGASDSMKSIKARYV